jgi:hypothetical protein
MPARAALPPTAATLINTPAPVTLPAARSGALPQLVAARKQPSGYAAVATPRPISIEIDPSKPADSRFEVTLSKIRSVLPVSRLHGQGGDEVVKPGLLIEEVVQYAAGSVRVPKLPGDVAECPDGTWICQFPSTVSLAVAPLKLVVLHETWGVSIEQPEPTRIVLRKTQSGGGLWGAISGSKKRSGIEVEVHLPDMSAGIGEITLNGHLFGSPTGDFARQAPEFTPRFMAAIRSQLANIEDRRKHPRVAADIAVTLYPLYHPAAALYTPAMLRTLEEDFARIPQLLASSVPADVPVPESLELDADVIPFPQAAQETVAVATAPAEQLELF